MQGLASAQNNSFVSEGVGQERRVKTTRTAVATIIEKPRKPLFHELAIRLGGAQTN